MSDRTPLEDLADTLDRLTSREVTITAGMSDSDVRELNERLERERRRAANRRGE